MTFSRIASRIAAPIAVELTGYQSSEEPEDPTPPLPASALEYWHSELGASAASAVGQIQGWTLTGQGSPTVATDGANFNGRNVYKATAAGGMWFLQQGISHAAYPYLYMIARWRTVPAALQDIGGIGRFVDKITAGLGGNSSGQHLGRSMNAFGGYDATGPSIDTAVHRLECWNDGVSTVNFRIDGSITSGSTTIGAAATSDSLAIGGNATFPVQSADVSIAFMLLNAGVPSGAELTALNEWAQSYWGAP